MALALLAILVALGWREARKMVRDHPERFPWTDLDLDDPIGPFTGVKLARLTGQAARCQVLLRSAGLTAQQFEQRSGIEPRCRVDDGVVLRSPGEKQISYSPPGLVTSCPVAAALALWEREIVQPAARRHLGQNVTRVTHAGSFNCRRLYGRAEGRFSEHATADAVDITGFRLADGREVSVQSHWGQGGANTLFLREVRDGACDLFSTVLSPDYNAAHADHFHFDQAEQGALGWRPCR